MKKILFFILQIEYFNFIDQIRVRLRDWNAESSATVLYTLYGLVICLSVLSPDKVTRGQGLELESDLLLKKGPIRPIQLFRYRDPVGCLAV